MSVSIAEIALAHERIERERGDLHSGRLVVDTDRAADRFDEIDRTDIAVRIGWIAGAPRREIQSGKVLRWCGRRCVRSSYRYGVIGRNTGQGNPFDAGWLRLQLFMLSLLAGRQLAQVDGCTGGPRHRELGRCSERNRARRRRGVGGNLGVSSERGHARRRDKRARQ